MKKITLLLLIVEASVSAQTVFINEIHYDNASTDANEAIEIAGPAGTDLSAYTIELYNDAGSLYDTENLTGIIPNQQDALGTLTFSIAGIQNGSADGLALINAGTVVQLLSYEGILTATGGTALGMTSVDIGVSESGTTANTESLQLAGTGAVYTDFTWQSAATATQGSVNNGQTFDLTVLSNPKNTALQNQTVFYPNPTSIGKVTLKTTSTYQVEVWIYNSLGVIVSVQTASNNQAISMEGLAAGVYFVQLTINGNTSTKRVVVQ